MIAIDRLDHLVLTVASLEATERFYSRLLGMEVVTFGAGRKALRFGAMQINLHERGREFEPKAARPTPGSADLCFLTPDPVETVLSTLSGAGVEVELGPVPRSGAAGAFTSVYFRDPDGNLIEVSHLDGAAKIE